MRIFKRAVFALAIPTLFLAGCGSAGKEDRLATPSSDDAVAVEARGVTISVDSEIPESAPTEGATGTFTSLTCQDVRKRPAPGLCGVLEKAPRADVSDASTQRAIAVWRKIEGPFAALSGRETALTILSAEARLGVGENAKPIPPAAFICPGAPPTVYVPDTLLALISTKQNTRTKYPEDFLAFVIGHELAHRMNDLTPDGCQLAAFQRPGKGQREEELADSRSAFFMTNVGFSASKIANDDLVSKFLQAEFDLGREDSKGRRDSLLSALTSFGAYEALYQTGLVVAMTGEMEAADRLLSWTDELLTQQGVPLPEVRVVRAITRINRAAKMAPWTAKLGLPVGIDQLRCTPLHPGHSGLWEKPAKRVRGPDIELGRRLLKEALQLLAEAEARGATAFTVSAARACAALYLGDARAAREAQAIADQLVPKRAPTPVTAALARNRTLVEFLDYIDSNPTPQDEESEAFRTWAKALSATLSGRRTPAELAAVFRALENFDADAPGHISDDLSCSEASSSAPRALSPIPTSNGELGQCPTGFRLAHRLPSTEAAERTGTANGVTVCQALQSEAQFLRVSLVATTDPPLEALERTILISKPPAHLERLPTWACHCSRLSPQGVSDNGELVYRARCPAMGVPRGALVAKDGKIHRVIQHSP